jgi:hypothetical protein
VNPKFIFYHHKNLALAKYVAHYADLPKTAPGAKIEFKSLPQQAVENTWAELPNQLRRLLFFARPDLVICLDDGVRPTHPVFAFEITQHVPARDHWMQRFPNLVGCAQEGVPGAYIMPFDMSEHPSFKSVIDPDFFFAYDRVTEIHQTPVFIAEWQTPDRRTPKGDSKFAAQPCSKMPDMVRAFEFLRTAVDAAFHGRPVASLMRERTIIDLRDRIRQRAYQSQLPSIASFKRLQHAMPNNRPLTLPELRAWLKGKSLTLPTNLPDRLVRRNKFLVFTPQVSTRGKTQAQLRSALMTRIDKKGGDPYLGQPLAFDYLFCRLGTTPYERDCSVVANLTDLKFEDLAKFHRKVWEKSPLQFTSLKKIKHIPTYTMYLKEGGSETIKNFLKLYAFTADLIVFEDGIIYF